MLTQAMLLSASLVALQVLAVADANSASLPIQTPDDAIAMAKDVCVKYGGPLYDEDMNKTTIEEAMPSLKWSATLKGDHWHVDTISSVVAGTNDHLLMVDIPVSGPSPKACVESLYNLLGLPPRAPKPRGLCKPSDISEVDAQRLAGEAVAPHGGVWLESSSAKSEPDAWIGAAFARSSELSSQRRPALLRCERSFDGDLALAARSDECKPPTMY